ncbi:MAG: hypothetical protein GVY18_06680 [Bacteroidetes bacterium]|jgi:pimeloyl-ACP methyl ester carboxylesterase|nr:hypothetical protein [Bacteroidota bacterium]
MTRTRSLIALGCALVLALAGCAPRQPEPDLPALYNRSAQYHGPERNPVILIPGITGSKLRDTTSGTLVWGAFSGDFADPETPEGARLFALPMQRGAPLQTLTDSVDADGALDRVQVDVLGLPIELGAYVQIMNALGVGGYRSEALDDVIDYGDDHFTCFQFDYDWRRDNVENAIRLHAFIEEKRAYLQREYARRFGLKEADIQFDLVAHSMGGLIARYYLRYGPTDLPADGSLPDVTWAGTEHVGRAVLVGPPNAGATKAIAELVRGRHLSRFVPSYAPALLGTFPSVYQLLPRARHGALLDTSATEPVRLDPFDPDLWERLQWGLADPEQDRMLQWLLPEVDGAAERRAIALDHQRKALRRARHVTAALDAPATPPDDLDLFLIAGDAEETPAALAVDPASGALDTHATAPGDGTVLRTSALMDERVGGDWAPHLVSPIGWTRVLFLFDEHLEMTQRPVFTDNLLYYLLEAPPPGQRR